jgi:N-acetylglutamate synthase-like GNAT family acetyltransferase
MRSKIRKAQKADVDTIQLLFKELTGHEISLSDIENRLELIENSPIDSLYVYEYDNIVVGAMAFRIRENIEEKSRFGEISLIVVNSAFRGKGIGKELMEYAEDLAKKYNCIGTWLVSGFGKEEEAHPFYKSLKYNITGYRFVKMF